MSDDFTPGTIFIEPCSLSFSLSYLVNFRKKLNNEYIKHSLRYLLVVFKWKALCRQTQSVSMFNNQQFFVFPYFVPYMHACILLIQQTSSQMYIFTHGRWNPSMQFISLSCPHAPPTLIVSHLQLLQDDIVVTKMLSLLSLSATVVLHALPSPIINVDQFHIKAELLSCEAARWSSLMAVDALCSRTAKDQKRSPNKINAPNKTYTASFC